MTRELSQAELDVAVERLAAWTVVRRRNERAQSGQAVELHRQFTFASFEDAMHFMLTASRRIGRMDHHPEWLNAHRRVAVWLTTWETGFKPSARDLELAGYLDRLYAEYQPALSVEAHR
jgi:4a-hydroxytetrahydrobiopterin dehydratase